VVVGFEDVFAFMLAQSASTSTVAFAAEARGFLSFRLRLGLDTCSANARLCYEDEQE
jgi:hypothetical protein